MTVQCEDVRVTHKIYKAFKCDNTTLYSLTPQQIQPNLEQSAEPTLKLNQLLKLTKFHTEISALTRRTCLSKSTLLVKRLGRQHLPDPRTLQAPCAHYRHLHIAEGSRPSKAFRDPSGDARHLPDELGTSLQGQPLPQSDSRCGCGAVYPCAHLVTGATGKEGADHNLT